MSWLLYVYEFMESVCECVCVGTKGSLWCPASCGRWIIRSHASPTSYHHYTHYTLIELGKLCVCVWQRDTTRKGKHVYCCTIAYKYTLKAPQCLRERSRCKMWEQLILASADIFICCGRVCGDGGQMFLKSLWHISSISSADQNTLCQTLFPLSLCLPTSLTP